MMIKVTIVSDKGYRPVSALVTVQDIRDWNNNSKAYKSQALQKICCRKYWDSRDLKYYGYSKIKAEVFNPPQQ